MYVTTNKKVVFALLDTLVERWQAKKFPYNRKDATIPQTLIPEEIRKDQFLLACFYFYACIYMRGGIESGQAFRALIRMWRDDPHLFEPAHAQWYKPEAVATVLKKYVGWDSKNAGINWVENSRRLMQYWSGDPHNLIKGLRTYDEALRRIRNKLRKREQREAGYDGLGFRGFQPKMVSMLLYFYDWEGWLKPRFLYPTPADFHNFRLGLNQGGIVVEFEEGDAQLRSSEKISGPWRAVVMEYLRARKADPVEVADAIWLFSLVLCGSSPLNQEREVPHHWLEKTCFRCPIRTGCRFSIPAGPYYKKGLLVLRRLNPMETIPKQNDLFGF
jgi:hypothetical protein